MIYSSSSSFPQSMKSTSQLKWGILISSYKLTIYISRAQVSLLSPHPIPFLPVCHIIALPVPPCRLPDPICPPLLLHLDEIYQGLHSHAPPLSQHSDWKLLAEQPKGEDCITWPGLKHVSQYWGWFLHAPRRASCGAFLALDLWVNRYFLEVVKR